MKAKDLAKLLLKDPDADVYVRASVGNENGVAVTAPVLQGRTDGVQVCSHIVLLEPDENDTVFLPEVSLFRL